MESFDLIVLTSVNGLAAMWFYISSLFLCIFFFACLKLPFQPSWLCRHPLHPQECLVLSFLFSLLLVMSLLTGYIDTLTTLCEAKSFFHFQPLWYWRLFYRTGCLQREEKIIILTMDEMSKCNVKRVTHSNSYPQLHGFGFLRPTALQFHCSH